MSEGKGGEWRFRMIGFDLDRIAVKRRPFHWILTPDGDHGEEWCPDCGHFKVRNLRRHDRKRRADYILDGGWRTEHDGIRICAGCAAFLDGGLTTYGAKSELEYYRECGLSTQRDVDALYLSEIIGSLCFDDEDAPFALSLAEAVVALPTPSTSSDEDRR